jgi:hypothetical protein
MGASIKGFWTHRTIQFSRNSGREKSKRTRLRQASLAHFSAKSLNIAVIRRFASGGGIYFFKQLRWGFAAGDTNTPVLRRCKRRFYLFFKKSSFELIIFPWEGRNHASWRGDSPRFDPAASPPPGNASHKKDEQGTCNYGGICPTEHGSFFARDYHPM